ncbi:MAG: RES family NAD+ phosphorylase [Gemmatimonadetes bacterium]|nr:RES family NAD+ phosphorylase [Gemmatimonadota bacterium]
MLVWRLAREIYPALDGEGARLNGGRWNSPGTPLVYTAGSRALAALELLVWVDSRFPPVDLHLFEVEIPDRVSMERVDPAFLNPAWQQSRDAECRRIGDEWALSGRTLLLAVPSSLVPEETNYLVNPRHPEMAGVRVAGSRPFAFDPRLL